jgi:hypothetical protein
MLPSGTTARTANYRAGVSHRNVIPVATTSIKAAVDIAAQTAVVPHTKRKQQQEQGLLKLEIIELEAGLVCPLTRPHKCLSTPDKASLIQHLFEQFKSKTRR